MINKTYTLILILFINFELFRKKHFRKISKLNMEYFENIYLKTPLL